MKKITILLTSAFLVAVFKVDAANADSYNYTPYVGANYTFERANAFGVRPEHHAVGLYVGSEYSKYFSTELFANQSGQHRNHLSDAELKTSYYNYGLDILAYLPLFAEQKFSLLATAGIGEYVYKTKFSPTDRHNEHGLGYRFGGGAKYAWNNHWQTRFIARYVEFDKLSGYNHNMEYSLSMEYHFN